MLGLDEKIASLGQGDAFVLIAVMAVLLGLRHATDPAARFHDLGSGYYDERISAERKIRSHVRQLEALGLTVTLTPGEDAA